MCVKRCQNIFYWVKKKTCLGVLNREEIRDKGNATGLKEGRRNRNRNLQCSIHYNNNYNLVFEKNIFDDNYNLVYSDTTKFQLFDF